MDLRKTEESLFKALMIASTATIAVCTGLILVTVFAKGFNALSIEMITQTPKGGFYLGKEGGILNAIAGSVYLGTGSTFLAFCLSLPVVLYMNVYAKKNSRFTATVRFFLDIMSGIPSIVYGAFGFSMMLLFGLKASLLLGIISVAVIIFPLMCRAIDEVFKMIPDELGDASYSLGATKFETGFKVFVRQVLPGISTAILISFGRAIGDAATVLFTAGFTDSLPDSLLRPVATLPLAVFFQLGTPVAEVKERAYASALVLTMIVLIISITARFLCRKFTIHIIK
jgi:phosphate transport system permease protein